MDDDWGHDDSEHTLLQLKECHVFRIPPRTNAAGHYAKDWGELSKPSWILRCAVTAKGEQLFVKLQHDDGRDFAVCKASPGAIEPVVDSSRYFVLKIEDEKTGKHAFLGIGFHERSEAFDFNAAIADHAKHIRMEKEAAKAAQDFESRPKLDLSLQNKTITVSINISKPTNAAKQSATGTGILAPPPSKTQPNHTIVQHQPQPQSQTKPSAAVPSDFSFDDDWGDFASAIPTSKSPVNAVPHPTSGPSLLGNFSSITTTPPTAHAPSPTPNFIMPIAPSITSNIYQPSPPLAKAIPTAAFPTTVPAAGVYSPQRPMFNNNHTGSPSFAHASPQPYSFSMQPLGGGSPLIGGSPSLQQRPMAGSPTLQPSFPHSTPAKNQPRDDPFANLVKF